MSATRNKLDPKKITLSHRMFSTILEQSASLDTLLESKATESLSVQELQDVGLTYNEKSHYPKAIKFFKFALEELTQLCGSEENTMIAAECNVGLAIAARESGDARAAEQYFFTAKMHLAKINPESLKYSFLRYTLQKNLGIYYLKIQNYNQAIQCFEVALSTAFKSDQLALIPAVKSYYGMALILGGDSKSGFSELQAARNLYPLEARELSLDWATHRYHMGRAFQECGDNINAISEFNEALRLRLQMLNSSIGATYFNSRMGELHACLGQSYLVLGIHIEAETWLKKATKNYEELNEVEKLQNIKSLLQLITTLPLEKKTAMARSMSSAKMLEDLIRRAAANDRPEASSYLQKAVTNKHLQSGLGLATALVGLGVFAYKKWAALPATDSANQIRPLFKPNVP